jgi:hypothetical protein
MRSVLFRGAALTAALLAAAGCQPVRSDRSVNFSSDGKQVAESRGHDGVFIEDADGGPPTKIFQPDADVIAVSAPLWSPADRRLVFTTAKHPEKPKNSGSDLIGDLAFQHDVIYTCWLREPPRGGVEQEPVALFTAPCDHPGYVAANVAVRWRPDGRAVLYVKQTGPHLIELFSFDLEKKISERVFPQAAPALVFDWAPDGKHLACVVGSKENDDHSHDGVWVGTPGADDWWRVPQTEDLTRGDSGAVLERLRDVRPVWAADGKHFALINSRRADTKAPAEFTLRAVDVAARRVATLAAGREPIRDVHWRPDGGLLGFILDPAPKGDDAKRPAVNAGALCLLTLDGKQSEVAEDRPVRSFAGWDSTGARLAYVVADAVPLADDARWAFQFSPDLAGRDVVLVRGEKDPAPREALRGVRATFLQWSPTEPKLSLRVGFAQPYDSWLTTAPAAGNLSAVYDDASGAIHWKAAGASDKALIGHYYLLRRDYAEAWRWYEQTDQEAPAHAPLDPKKTAKGLAVGSDPLFFEYYCLTKLGRATEAAAKREQFDRTVFSPAAPDGKGPDLAWVRDLYVAESFLAVDAAEDGEAFFRDELRDAKADDARLSKALVLGQLLLLRGKQREYADLTADEVLPLLLRVVKQKDVEKVDWQDNVPTLLMTNRAVGLLPLCSGEFLKSLPEAQVRALAARWGELAKAADDGDKQLAVDLLLAAAHRRLDQADEAQAAEKRVAANPARSRWLGDKDLEFVIQEAREYPAMIAAIRRNPFGT